jgi:hypothetical protein
MSLKSDEGEVEVKSGDGIRIGSSPSSCQVCAQDALRFTNAIVLAY